MGAAKKRGTFEQRQQQAYDSIDAQAKLSQQAHDNILELERMERESAAMMQGNAAQFITAWWKHSGIESRIARKSAFIRPEVITAFENGVDSPPVAL